MILDAGVLIAADRGEASAMRLRAGALTAGRDLHTTDPVVAQVWRRGDTQARLARFLASVVVHPLDDGRAVGSLLARSGTSDVVDAHLVAVARRLGEPIITGDPDDIRAICDALPGPAPTVYAWP